MLSPLLSFPPPLSEKVFVSQERVSGFPEKEADLRGSPGTSGEVWGTSGEVWGTSGEVRETSGEPLECLVPQWGKFRGSRRKTSGEVAEKLPGKFAELLGKSGDFPEARGSLTPFQRLAKFVSTPLGRSPKHRMHRWRSAAFSRTHQELKGAKAPQVCCSNDSQLHAGSEQTKAQMSHPGSVPGSPWHISKLRYLYTQNDYRTELHYFRIIFGNSCSVITEPNCFWNYLVLVRSVSRGLPNPLPNCFGNYVQ